MFGGFLLAGNALAEEPGFTVVRVHTTVAEDGVKVSALLNFQFTDTVAEAVRNGIPVTLEVKVKVERPEKYWWPEEVSMVRQRYQLRYHALSQQYLVRNLNNGVQNHFANVRQALAMIGQVDGVTLMKDADISDLTQYRLLVRTRLDIGALPVPLRLWAYLDPGWYLSSDWFEQPLNGK